MRTRKILTPGFDRTNAPVYRHHPSTGYEPMYTVDVPPEPARLVSHMTDDIERNGNIFHDVSHYKYVSLVEGHVPEVRPNNSEPYSIWTHYTGPVWYPWECPTMPLVASVFAAFPTWSKLPSFEKNLETWKPYSGWVVRDWKAREFTLAGDFSLVNFLLEVPETINLAKSWLSKRALIERYHALLGKNQRLPHRLKAAANERLAHVYGTRLFLQDAERLFTILTSWKARADRFLADAGKPKMHYKVPLVQFDPEIMVERPFPVFTASDSYVQIVVSRSLEAHAMVCYKYSVPYMSAFYSRLWQLSESFGIKLDAGIIWDAIPLSFVVDWFINVGKWLHSNVSRDWVRMDVKQVDFCNSAKFHYSRTLYWIRRHDSNPRFTTRIFADATSVYRRERGNQMPSLSKQNLDLNKQPWKIDRIINAVALGTQRLIK